jgi:DMSO/TMAO reductase YedYZ heme-binding membrane subunit
VNGQGWWYLTRTSGILAWALLGASVALGLLQSARSTPNRSPAWFVDLHRGLAGVGCWALGVHLVALLADSFANLELLDLLVPLRPDVSPGGVAWGIVAFYLVAVVEITSLAIRRLSWRTWRRVHYLGLAVFWLATLHGLLAGTDAQSPLLWIPAVALLVTLAAITVLRFARVGTRTSLTVKGSAADAITPSSWRPRDHADGQDPLSRGSSLEGPGTPRG